MPDEDAIPLDQSLLKVLASDTRMDILRLLRQRRMTVTEIARALDLQKATILEHLEKLQGADLIRRMEDERLWVYYELSRRGQKIVNPGRARVMLIIGTAFAAAVVAVALLLALQSATQPAPSEGDPPPLDLDLASSSFALGGTGVSFTVLTPEPLGAPRAFLVPEGGSAQTGYPLLAEANGSELRLHAAGTVPPGAYRLVLVDAATGRDNALDAPRVRVVQPTGSVDPATWWRGVSPGELTATLAVEGQPATGVLTLRPLVAGTSEAFLLHVRNGTGTLAAASLDAAPAGAYELLFRPEGSDLTAPVSLPFEVRDTQVAVAPLHVRGGRTTSLRVTVVAGEEAPAIALDGVPSEETDRQGATRSFAVAPQGPGEFQVRIGRLPPWTVRVHPTLDIAVAALPGPLLELTARAADGSVARDVGVVLDGATLGTTDATGRLQFPPPAPGQRNLTLRLPGGGEVERPIAVHGYNVSDPPSDLQVQPRAETAPPQRARVTVAVANRAPASEALTLIGLLNGTPVTSSDLRVPSNGTARGALEAVASAGPQQLVLRAEALPRPSLTFVDRAGGPAPPTAPAAPPTAGNGTAGNASGGTTTPPGSPPAGGATSGSVRGLGWDFEPLTVAIDVAEPAFRVRSDDAAPATLQPLGPLDARREGAAAAAPDVEPALAVLGAVGAAFLLARRRR